MVKRALALMLSGVLVCTSVDLTVFAAGTDVLFLAAQEETTEERPDSHAIEETQNEDDANNAAETDVPEEEKEDVSAEESDEETGVEQDENSSDDVDKNALENGDAYVSEEKLSGAFIEDEYAIRFLILTILIFRR